MREDGLGEPWHTHLRRGSHALPPSSWLSTLMGTWRQLAQALPRCHLERVTNNLYSLLPKGLCPVCQSNGKIIRVLFSPVFKQKDGGLHMAVAQVRGGTDSVPLGSRGEGAHAFGCRWEISGPHGSPFASEPAAPTEPWRQAQEPCGCLPAGRASVWGQLPQPQLHHTPKHPTLDAQIAAFPGNPVYIFVG